jgi:hypothetical protein
MAVRTSIKDDQNIRRLISSTTPDTLARLQQLVREDRHRIIQGHADEIEIGYGSCRRIVTAELSMQRVTAKFVPWIVTAGQK